MRECEKCGKRELACERDLKRCSRCHIVLYCSSKCQKADWDHHKRVCRPCDDPKTLPKCGLCGNRRGPFKLTECCNRLICDDDYSYEMFSYSKIHCARNHARYSLCTQHYNEKHPGKWQDCKKCKEDPLSDRIHGGTNHDGAVPYEYAWKAGNPPGKPFKFNFDEDAVKFDWNKIRYPICSTCKEPVDTAMGKFCITPDGTKFMHDACLNA